VADPRQRLRQLLMNRPLGLLIGFFADRRAVIGGQGRAHRRSRLPGVAVGQRGRRAGNHLPGLIHQAAGLPGALQQRRQHRLQGGGYRPRAGIAGSGVRLPCRAEDDLARQQRAEAQHAARQCAPGRLARIGLQTVLHVAQGQSVRPDLARLCGRRRVIAPRQADPHAVLRRPHAADAIQDHALPHQEDVRPALDRLEDHLIDAFQAIDVQGEHALPGRLADLLNESALNVTPQ